MAVNRSLNFTSCLSGKGECSCPRSATVVHSVAVDRTCNLSVREAVTQLLNYRRPQILTLCNPFFFSDGLVQAEERGKNERWQCFSPQYCKMSQFLSMERAFVSKRRLRRSKCLGPFRTIAFAYNARSRTVLFFL